MKGHAGGMKTPFAAIIIALLPSTADAMPVGADDNVFKCQATDGYTVYQSSPCTGGQRELKRWETSTGTPSREDARQRAQVEQAIERARQSVRAHNARVARGRSSSARVRASGADACDAARAKREAALARAGLKRNFALLRTLDDAVFSACR